MKTLKTTLSLLVILASSSSMAFIKPSMPQIDANQESLVENVVYKGTAAKASDLTTKATYRLEISAEGVAELKLPSCSATLISKDILLTAAHCLHPETALTYFVKSSAGGRTQTYKVTDFIRHEKYEKLKGAQGAISAHDIALVKLDRPLLGGIPAQLPKKNWLPSSVESVLVAGYGDNGLPDKTQEELMKDPRVIALLEESKKNPAKNEEEGMKIIAELLSIATEKPLLWTRSKAQLVTQEGAPVQVMKLTSGQSVCSGDSGGPSYSRSANSGLMVVGVHSTSSNANCEDTGKLWWKQQRPGYDTFVPFYIDWIQVTAAKLRN